MKNRKEKENNNLDTKGIPSDRSTHNNRLQDHLGSGNFPGGGEQ